MRRSPRSASEALGTDAGRGVGRVRPDGFLLSAVVPVHDEEACLDDLVDRLGRSLSGVAPRHEILLVDDASTDGSFERIEALSSSDPRVRGIRLSRNEGSQVALLCGLEHAHGDVVVTLDADLQHPPEDVPAMVELWRQGFDVVHMVARRFQERSIVRAAVAGTFYAAYNALADVRIPPNGPDFRLLDRRCVDALLRLRDRVVFLRGMTHRIGFRQTERSFDVPPRHAGRSAYTLRSLSRQAAGAFVSFARLPLIAPLYVGLAGVGAAAAAAALAWAAPERADAASSALLIVAVALLGACLVALGVLGAYVSALLDEARRRPRYFVERTVGAGFDAGARGEGGPARAAGRDARRAGEPLSGEEPD